MRLSALARRVAQGAVLVGLLAGSGAYVALDHTITVSVDGTDRQVRTFADSVGEALDDAGIDVGAHDVVAPAVGAGLPSNDHIVLERGRPVTLTIDGTHRAVWVTARSVGDLVDDLGLRADGAVLSASRSRRIPLDGLELSLRLPKTVTVTADGSSRDVVTTTVSVAQLLADEGIAVGPTDQVVPDPATVPAAGMQVTVTRVATAPAAVETPIPFATIRQGDGDLTKGTEKVVQAGVEGVRRQVFQVTLADGQETGRVLASDQVVRPPQDQIVHYGTKTPPVRQTTSRSASTTSTSAPRRSTGDAEATSAPRRSTGDAEATSAPRRSTSDADGLNWPALAQCESSGNPRAQSGPYYGLYQFSIGTWQSVGGSGRPSDASASEQTYRAKLLYQREGDSPWPTCGPRLYS